MPNALEREKAISGQNIGTWACIYVCIYKLNGNFIKTYHLIFSRNSPLKPIHCIKQTYGNRFPPKILILSQHSAACQSGMTGNYIITLVHTLKVLFCTIVKNNMTRIRKNSVITNRQYKLSCACNSIFST